MGEEAKQELAIKVWLNGKECETGVDPGETLLELIRDRFGLTGVKRSCDMEVCGACTVLLDGKPVSSCTTLAFEARDKKILTIEGMAFNGKLHPIQEAFIEGGGFQCGFCTPGMILTAKALLDENPDPSEGEIIEYMEGNLCRCTGYKMIVESIKLAVEKMKESNRSGVAAMQSRKEG